ncbi:tigger transposable element-derived protein 4-like [Hydractinia symbiolongicarpus]|uniref:tigger transposable element-derived protein 4-like n=1 Tax=Hydractinia symbiolongicarpus TaxID=13093 RepID=UPI00254DAC23|nr:tigger transposable element-derived protein 4-like [Hydractinia symbiolongicarpus]
MTSSWNETTLPTILSNYKLEDTFNADEFGLFYQCLPEKTYHLKGEKCSGGKKSKLRFTGMAAASATGEKLRMFVIGKSKKPRCFNNIKHLPCQYTSQKKSWMDSEIFENWVRKLDQKFRVDGRKIVLIIDNCPAHPSISNLTNIHLVFLPPNTTSVLQPMDQGVIRSLKAHYRRRVVRLLCSALENNKPLPKISILSGMKILADSWEAVTKQTIINCFKKSGISSTGQQDAIADSDDPFKDLQESLDDLREADPSLVPNDLSANDLVTLDDEVIATAPQISNEDIIDEFRKSQDDEAEDDGSDMEDDSFDIVVEKPSRSKVECSIDLLKDLAMCCEKGHSTER